MPADIDREKFLQQLGGADAADRMTHEARADALDDALHASLATRYPDAARIEAQIATRNYRRGVGKIFVDLEHGGTVERLPPMPARPTLLDFFEHRFTRTRDHCFQSARHAMQRGADEQVILACLLHDLIQEIMRTDHGYWGAQLFEPYVPERTTFAIRYHQALRFFADEAAGYEYPQLYHQIYGYDYVPAPHIQADYERVRGHRWYDAARAVTVSDLYAFAPDAEVSIDPFVDIIGRHFREPRQGLGNDDSPVAHMWRTIANPDAPL